MKEMMTAACWRSAMGETERRERNAHRHAFYEAMRQRVAGKNWEFLHGVIFFKYRGWLIANAPQLSNETGAMMCLTFKPLSIEPLFWEIMGLPVQGEASLSSRLPSDWTVNPQPLADYIGHGLVGVNELADLTFEWTQCWSDDHTEMLDIGDMLTRLGNLEQLTQSNRILAVCLSILDGDFSTARHLCLSGAIHQHVTAEDDGGVIAVKADGTRLTFFDKALSWLATERRRSLRIV